MIVVAGRKETVLGFGLAGVDNVVEITDKTTEEEFKRKIEELEPVILIVDEFTADRFENILNKLREKMVIIEVPAFGYKGKSSERLKKLIKEAFGMELNV